MDQHTYERLAESSPALLAAFNDIHVRWVNAAWTQFLGWTVDAARDESLRALQHPSDVPLFDAAIAAASASVASSTQRTRMRHADGSYRMIDWFVAPLAQGLFYGRDVGKQMRTEAALDQRVQLLMQAEEIAGVGSWSVDVATSVQTWSPQVFRIYGLVPQETAPPLTEAIAAYHPDDRERVTQLVADAALRAAPFEFELRLVRADGEIRHVFASGRCAVDAATGKTATIFGTFLDVTDRDRVRDDRARDQRLMTMGMLAAGVGHEMNNPLTFVAASVGTAYEELAALARVSPSGRLRDVLELLADARVGTERLTKLVRGIRSFALADAPVVATEVRRAVELSMTMASHEWRNRATCVLDIDAALLVDADESRLGQVLVNLLCNAAQSFATPDPHRNQILIRAIVEPTQFVAISVTDNGPGMTGEVAARIFEPFYTTKPSGVGTGLGLAISQSIVEGLGGRLSCETALGVGTTFTMRLLQSVHFDRAPEPPAQANVREHAGHIVIIDDEPMLLRSLERLLDGQNRVTTFADARTALEFLRTATDVDAILCDLMMPHLTGQELFEAVAAVRPDLKERFVFMSGGVTRDGLRQFIAQFPRGYIEKPYDPEYLKSVLRSVMAQPASTQ